jgi:hypothetical protein
VTEGASRACYRTPRLKVPEPPSECGPWLTATAMPSSSTRHRGRPEVLNQSPSQPGLVLRGTENGVSWWGVCAGTASFIL